MTDAKTDSRGEAGSAPRKNARRRWRWPLAVVLIVIFLLLDIGPTVPKPAPATAPQAERTRLMIQRTRDALNTGNGRAVLSYSGAELTGAANLAGNIRRLGQFDARLSGGTARFRMSQQLLGPVWINVTADVDNVAKGFPAVRLRVGRLPLGETLSRAAVDFAQRVVRRRGISTPPLDTLINGVTITPASITANVFLPGSGEIGRGLVGLRNTPVDPVAAARIYCFLVKRGESEPTGDFAVVVNRAFAAPSPSGPTDAVEANRAALVALAAYTIGPGAMRLAPGMQDHIAGCPAAPRPALIIGRDDLPKHWSLSAALAVTLGDDVSTAMGEWKELSDSRPSGSGFSFIDLAADRAGLAVAKKATDPATAAPFAGRMRRATAEQIIPLGAIALTEGLTEAQFVARYGTTGSDAFAAATKRVDRVIARTIGE